MLTLGVVGCGLIGGSILKALVTHESYRLCAFDPDVDTIAAIREALPEVASFTLPMTSAHEVIWEAETLAREAPGSLAALRACQVLVLAGPVDTLVPTARALSILTDALMTDVGSIKAPLCRALASLRFIGGHPMAGSERHGFAPSRADMFQNAPYILIDEAAGPEDLGQLSEIVKDLGAYPVTMTAERHDRVVAYVSHLPHVVATALVRTVGADEDDMTALSAGGFRDITRIASSNPQLWAEICMASAPELIPALDRFMEALHAIRGALVAAEEDEVRRFFDEGYRVRSQLPMKGLGALQADQAVTVFLDDVPGALARITALLAEASISVRNLAIQNARAYEGGQLRIYVADPMTAKRCCRILEGAGYVCE